MPKYTGSHGTNQKLHFKLPARDARGPKNPELMDLMD